MSNTPPTLHMLCGKIGAGKSTLAVKLAERHRAVLITEDDWLSALYGDQMSTGRDFVRFSAKLRAAMGPHVTALLRAGVSVVLDQAATTVEIRAWMKSLLDGTDASHQLHVLNAPDELCLARLHARNAAGDHPFAATEAQFRRFTAHYVPPTEDEDFNIFIHEVEG